MASKTQKPPAGAVRVSYRKAEQLSLGFVNHMLVTSTNDEFVIVLGQLYPPLDESARMNIEEVELTPVARVVMTPEMVRRAIQVLSTNLERYENRKDP